MLKGFITVANGEYYCKLAKHLFMSYKMFGNCDFPFYVITDKEGEELLKDVFDGVIVWDGFTKSTVNKLVVFTNTPFEETIFIDADCSIVNDIGYLFERFEENGSELSAISGIHSLEGRKNGIQFSKTTIDKLGLTYDFPNFNGGVYFFNKAGQGKEMIDYMMNYVLPNYNELDLMVGNSAAEMYDEPVVIVSMIKWGMKTIPQETNAMYLVQNAKKVKWNMRKRNCSFQWYDKMVSPSIIHWKVGGTETYNYEKYDAKLFGLYYKKGFLFVFRKQLLSFVKFYIYPTLLKIFPGIQKIAKKYK